MKPYKPEPPMMTFEATPNELIALGAVVHQYILHVERKPEKTKDQLDMIALLCSFQGRLALQTQNFPPPPLLSSREVHP